MKKIIQQIRLSYGNLRIKYKLFILISSIMIISFSFTFFGLQYAFHIYDEQLYSKSSQVLSTTSNSIENDLKSIEDVSYLILTDPQIQQNLSKLHTNVTEYETFILRNQMNDLLLSYVNKEQNILSVNLIDAHGKEYIAGPRAIKLNEFQKLEITNEANQADGGNIWSIHRENSFTIVAAREIKGYNYLSFDKLGTLIIFINMDKLVNQTLA